MSYFHAGLLPVLKRQTNNIWICLVFLLLADAVTTPYAGLVHDARLYALQALSHLNPDFYRKDLFFLYGSQDSFTIFSSFYAALISLLGLHPASLLIYIISRVIFLAGVLLFFRACSRDTVLPFIAALIIASGQVHFLFFDVNEPFLTPRLAAYGLSLISLACLINGASIRCVVAICLAGLMHPLVALAPGAVITLYWLRHGRTSLICALAAAPIAVIVILFLISPDALRGINLRQIMDNEWQHIVFARSSYLLPGGWGPTEWQGVFSAFALTGLSIKYCKQSLRSFLAIILIVSLSSLLISIFLTYVLPIALGIQLQLWRAIWLIRVISVLLSLITGKMLWQSRHVLQKCSAVLLLFPFVLSSVAATGGLLYILPALAALAIPNKFTTPIDKLRWLPIVLVITLVLLQLSALFFNYQTYFHLSHSVYKNVIMALAVLNPVLPLIFIGLVIVIFSKARLQATAFLCIVAYFGVIYLGLTVGSWYPEQLQNERNVIKRTAPDQLLKWQKKIAPGSLILNDSLPTKTIWFTFHSSCYYSIIQGAGVVFNRKLAINYDKRQKETQDFFTPGKIQGKQRWCRKRKIDYVISKKKLNLTLLASVVSYNLYIIH